jgi:hypothetical protein
VRNAVSPLAEEPVPEALRKSIEAKIAAAKPKPPENVVAFPAKPKPAPVPRPWALPLAASIAAAIAGVAGYAIRDAAITDAAGQIAIARPLPAIIAEKLDRGLSGEEGAAANGKLKIITTVLDANKAVCREFEFDAPGADTIVAVACKTKGTDWQTKLAIAAPASGTGYAPASSMSAADAYFDAIGAGEPLPPEDEKAALDSLR